ncbi:class I SAM-dependent methyltransferase [Myxococcus sp. CA039A]|uniref:class I SAM-dependent methyltransferase n=1 Tax=Myxococcus sp. CA039A TaxID=2741737 RepID=UPI00157B0937|nr:class I SAM-dependent methyltransferase [Myxococcus sp. CA039A]NTX55134.1 class I SAM-dependent methyltransferase [Myxococcus sp. CA039A]
MAEDSPSPPARRDSSSDDDLHISLPRLLVIRVWSLGLEGVNRLGDFLVLAWRPRLLLAWLRLWLREVLVSPYRPRRSFELIRVLHASHQDFHELMYGETPVHTALSLFRKAGLTKGSRLVDLGAGRGRALLAARWLGAEALGLELLEQHVALASGPLARTGAVLRQADATQADLSLGDATHVFINWTAFSPDTRARLVTRLLACRPGTRVLTVTRPVEAKGFTVLSRHRALFTWGLESVWIHEVQGAGTAGPGAAL